jgi:hypothetical protein
MARRNPEPQTKWGFQEQAIDLFEREGMIAMAKKLWTAEQLSDMIVSASAVRCDVQVRNVYGWRPIVVASPGDLIGYQRRVEEIASRLRLQFSLRE